jgi:hypothetical protein
MTKISYGTGHIEGKMTDLLKPLFKADKKNFLIINNLVKNWEKVVGKKYAKLCEAKSVSFDKNKQGKLTIAVFNSAVGFFLQSNSEILLEKIASLYGYKAISKIIIKQEAQEVAITKRQDATLPETEEKELQESLKGVKDKDLAATLSRLGREILSKK